jgi:hypothetical protein
MTWILSAVSEMHEASEKPGRKWNRCVILRHSIAAAGVSCRPSMPLFPAQWSLWIKSTRKSCTARLQERKHKENVRLFTNKFKNEACVRWTDDLQKNRLFFLILFKLKTAVVQKNQFIFNFLQNANDHFYWWKKNMLHCIIMIWPR